MARPARAPGLQEHALAVGRVPLPGGRGSAQFHAPLNPKHGHRMSEDANLGGSWQKNELPKSPNPTAFQYFCPKFFCHSIRVVGLAHLMGPFTGGLCSTATLALQPNPGTIFK